LVVSADDICWLDASAIVEKVRSGELTAEAVVTAVLERIEAVDPRINAFTTVASDQALKAARAADARRPKRQILGPLDGVPVSIKDFIYTRGMLTTAGSRIHQDFVPEEDAIVVSRLKAAGAIIIGKTTIPEYCFKTVTDSPLTGVTRNPWNCDLTPGGSSGGSAAAVAAGLGPVSIGTDGGGSIRLPAALCGVAGFKPSTAMVPQSPGFSGWNLLGHTGPLARSVADLKLVFDVIAGPDTRDPITCTATRRSFSGEPRVAWTATLNDLEPEPNVASQLQRVVEAARSVTRQPVDHVSVRWDDPDLNFRVLVGADLAAALTPYLATHREVMDQGLVKLVEFGRSLTAVDLARSLDWRRTFSSRVLSFFENYDLLILPTAPVSAFSHEIVGPRSINGKKVSPYAWFGWTWPFNITGQPALSLPLVAEGELPVGIQIVGRPGEDDLVLSFARQLEDALGRPDIKPSAVAN
jgi:aspartyl-tRNA(Asn)/glutamyl-tRNA(Gln) amidotransferase subunit A